jgi:hypothetical protein
MTRIVSLALAALLFAGTVSISPIPANAADVGVAQPSYAPQPAYADTGVCSDPSVLRSITGRFRYQVRHVPNLPDVEITDFQNVYLNGYYPAREDHPIGRIYCGATVNLSGAYNRNIWYLIELGQGFASIGDNVEFCVDGFDRWFVYNGLCRVLREGQAGYATYYFTK